MSHIANAPQPSLASQISPWVLPRLQTALRIAGNANQTHPGVHYESSLYGPFNSLFTDIFPTYRRFMVKPQGLLRRERDSGVASDAGSAGSDWKYLTESLGSSADHSLLDDDEILPQPFIYADWAAQTNIVAIAAGELEETVGGRHTFGAFPDDYDPRADMSRDSFGNIVARRRKAGNSGNPDFIITKATESLTDDVILAIIEVKVADDGFMESYIQLARYMDFATSKRREAMLKGYLIFGSVIHVWGFMGAGVDAEWGKVASYPIGNLNRFNKELYGLAGLHWQV